jgi:hypothetical protein
MKIPEPTTPPMTIMVASNRPRRRASAGTPGEATAAPLAVMAAKPITLASACD